MYELPLFPLNTVLFPGMPLPLQIFEERYKEMIALCLRERRPFGVVLIDEGTAEHGPLAKPHDIGCTAEITRAQPLDDEGRMLIMSVGQARFRIVSLNYDRPYLVGMVEEAPVQFDSSDLEATLTEQLYPLVVEYLKAMAEIGRVAFDVSQVPHKPEPLAFLAASVIQLAPAEKQALLETENAAGLLRLLLAFYRREVPLLKRMPPADQGIFSLN